MHNAQQRERFTPQLLMEPWDGKALPAARVDHPNFSADRSAWIASQRAIQYVSPPRPTPFSLVLDPDCQMIEPNLRCA